MKSWKIYLAALASSIIVAFCSTIAFPNAAYGQQSIKRSFPVTCTSESIVKTEKDLEEKRKHYPTAIAVGKGGNLFQLYRSGKGEWLLTMRNPRNTKQVCVVAMGVDYIDIPIEIQLKKESDL